MRKKPLLIYLKILIILSPIPFGCVGRIFEPFFYTLILIFSFLALKDSGRENNRQPIFENILYKKWSKLFFCLFIGFLLFQVIPLPLFLLKILSPKTAETLSLLKNKMPGFHSISLVPSETIIFIGKFLVMAVFFWSFLHLNLKKKEMISLFHILIVSAFCQTLFGILKYIQGNRYFFLFFNPQPESEFSKFLSGTLGNPNHFAFYLEMLLPLALVLFLMNFQFLNFALRADVIFSEY